MQIPSHKKKVPMRRRADKIRLFGEYVMSIGFFILIFILLGNMIPRVYYTYFDRTVYYDLESPLKVDKKSYKACEVVKASGMRFADQSTSGFEIKELVLHNADGTTQEVYRTQEPLVIQQGGRKNITFYYFLPCSLKNNKDLPTGRYKWEGVIQLKFHDVQKEEFFETETFIIE